MRQAGESEMRVRGKPGDAAKRRDLQPRHAKNAQAQYNTYIQQRRQYKFHSPSPNKHNLNNPSMESPSPKPAALPTHPASFPKRRFTPSK